jgi:hypothetical protein
MKLWKPRLPKIAVPQSIVIWVVGMLSISLGLEFCYFNGTLAHIYSSDVTKLSVVIAGIFCWQSFMCGRQLWRYDKNKSSRSEALGDVEKGWMWSDMVLSLGMIGTVIGFMVMLSGFAGADFSNVENTQELIAKLSYGMSTALATTLVGLTSSVLLKLQFFMLEAIVRKEDETDLPF